MLINAKQSYGKTVAKQEIPACSWCKMENKGTI